MADTEHSGSGSPGSPGDRGRAPLLPLIHGRVRLLILSFLLRTRKAHAFTALRNDLDTVERIERLT